MHLHESEHDGIVTYHLQGDIDMHYAPVLRRLLQAKASCRCPALILDFSGVPFIDSTGIAVLLEYLRDASTFGGQFCFAALTEHVRHAFEIVRLDKAVSVFPDVAEAQSALKNRCVPAPPEPLFRAAPTND